MLGLSDPQTNATSTWFIKFVKENSSRVSSEFWGEVSGSEERTTKVWPCFCQKLPILSKSEQVQSFQQCNLKISPNFTDFLLKIS